MDDYDHIEYRQSENRAQTAMTSALNDPARFKPFEERNIRSDLDFTTIKSQIVGRYRTKYRNVFLMKGPQDILIYQQWIGLVKPKTIIEFGTYSGASALWLSDTCQLNGFKSKIVSVDIDPTLIDKRVKDLVASSGADVSFVQGDCNEIEKIFSPSFLANLEHPVAIIDDAHCNTGGVLKFFNEYLVPGDYIIAEDTHPEVPKNTIFDINEDAFEKTGDGKFRAVEDFCRTFKGSYAVDTYFADFLGYNYTWNSWIRKMQ